MNLELLLFDFYLNMIEYCKENNLDTKKYLKVFW